MTPPAVRFLRAGVIAGLVAPVAALAQTRFDNTVIPLEFLETSPWTVSAGARYATEGATVNFGQLGIVSSTRSAPPASEGADVNRFYDNGAVGADGLRSDEVWLDGTRFSAPGERYAGRYVDSAGNEFFAGDFLGYQEGRSRNWAANSSSQISGGRLALSLYSTQSSGGTAVSEKEASSGFEVSVSRRLKRFGRRVELGINALFGLNDIDAGTSGSVQANLITLTDYYNVYGTLPDSDKGYSFPDFEDYTPPGGVKMTDGREITVPIDQLPQNREITNTLNGATILGSWKINGAYYVVRVGPIVRVFVTDRLAFTFEAGLAGAFVGTDYEVRESLEIEGLAAPITTTEESEDTAVLGGFYGAGAVEYWMTDRTNAYAGAAYEALDNYQQSVGGRTAEIDIGSTITVRLGLTTRF